MQHIVRARLDGICAAAGRDLADLDLQVITASSLGRDLDADRARLEHTVARLKPRLLVVDPFVRLHRIDASGEVAPLLAYLRDLQRRHAVGVIVVHHARKGAANIGAGQALFGSSEFHAWGDSNLCLRRDQDDCLVLTVEHRAGPVMASVAPEHANTRSPSRSPNRASSPTQTSAMPVSTSASLANTDRPKPFPALRTFCRVRAASLYETLAAMIAAGTIAESANGYDLVNLRASSAVNNDRSRASRCAASRPAGAFLATSALPLPKHPTETGYCFPEASHFARQAYYQIARSRLRNWMIGGVPSPLP